MLHNIPVMWHIVLDALDCRHLPYSPRNDINSRLCEWKPLKPIKNKMLLFDALRLQATGRKPVCIKKNYNNTHSPLYIWPHARLTVKLLESVWVRRQARRGSHVRECLYDSRSLLPWHQHWRKASSSAGMLLNTGLTPAFVNRRSRCQHRQLQLWLMLT